MICNCIYKKVDEKDECKKKKACKSFHILSKYLESKDVTGIIEGQRVQVPCSISLEARYSL